MYPIRCGEQTCHISFQISVARLVGPNLPEALDLTTTITDMLQATGIAPRPQSEPHNEENDVIDEVKREEIINVDSDEEKERELLVHIHLCWPISPINS